MSRELKTDVLDEFARSCAARFPLDSMWSQKNPGVATDGREWVLQSLVNLHFKDEFEHVVEKIRLNMGPDTLKEFEEATDKVFTPRSDKVLAEQLEDASFPGELLRAKAAPVISGLENLLRNARRS